MSGILITREEESDTKFYRHSYNSLEKVLVITKNSGEHRGF